MHPLRQWPDEAGALPVEAVAAYIDGHLNTHCPVHDLVLVLKEYIGLSQDRQSLFRVTLGILVALPMSSLSSRRPRNSTNLAQPCSAISTRRTR